ncbi:MAG: type II toxin-antitoxin system VapC family toxin [Planctomycetes bacterium]|nr:type II toxin-antitoxin system VapC family toxin [Planctomycetota bacterium]
MKGFLDTSSLCKKYIEEEGSETLVRFLNDLSDVIVSPVCWIEMHSAVERRIHEGKITFIEAARIYTEMKIDFNFFGKVVWNDDLEHKSVEFVQHYQIKTLDSIQLASAYLSQAEMFVTSDKKLFDIAKKELKKVEFI